ncbi:major capsid protein [Lactiplantibacillus plantarum]|uniref:phage major capsid protein n=1 Tax=Lactiplantibacillus plantarum TaxID=1590 RepID=UPI00311CCE7B
MGDATDVDEGGAIDYASLSTDTDMFTIKKAGKGVKITDEAALSGYGDPVGEGQRQITMAIASKIDNDILATAMKSRLTLSTGVDVTSLDMVDAIEAAFNDDTSEYAVEDDSPTTGVLFMNPKDVNKLRKAAAENWTRATDLGDNILINGTFGELLGWQIVRSRKIKEGSALAVKPGAMRTYMKRNVLSEKGRDMDHKITKFNADEHYGVAIYDDTKLLVINPFDVEGGTVINQNVTSTKDATVKKSNKGKAVASDTPSK